MAVSWNIAVRSSAENPFVSFLNWFQSTVYEHDSLSTGKLLSNMHRLGPNCSIVWRYHFPLASSSSSDVGGRVSSCQPYPLTTIWMPPTFATTFGHFASSATAGFHAANTSSRCPACSIEKNPTRDGIHRRYRRADYTRLAAAWRND